MELTEAARRRLRSVLARSAEQGWLGPGPVDSHIDHALPMAALVAEVGARYPQNPQAMLDLGSGGGVPGLVIAVCLAPTPVALLDAGVRRCAFLRSAAADLADCAVLTVIEGRAEEIGRQPEYEGQFGTVTARSFGRPAVTAECGARFLAVGGVLIVSEPPAGALSSVSSRWDASAMAPLGLAPTEVRDVAGTRIAAIAKIAPTDTRYPRRVGVPAKRPLW